MQNEQICNKVKEVFEKELKDIVVAYEKVLDTTIEVTALEYEEDVLLIMVVISGSKKNNQTTEICEVNELYWDLTDTEESNLLYSNAVIKIGCQIYRVRVSDLMG